MFEPFIEYHLLLRVYMCLAKRTSLLIGDKLAVDAVLVEGVLDAAVQHDD